jgi:hypothetical protein
VWAMGATVHYGLSRSRYELAAGRQSCPVDSLRISLWKAGETCGEPCGQTGQRPRRTDERWPLTSKDATHRVYGGGGGACTSAPPRTVDIGVYGTATSSTRVDYNITDPTGTNPPYAWGTPQATLAAFQAASGQGAHDIEADPNFIPAVPGLAFMPSYLSPAVDSADSGAPGVQSTDVNGAAPGDDPYTPNSGVGPLANLDRGRSNWCGRRSCRTPSTSPTAAPR